MNNRFGIITVTILLLLVSVYGVSSLLTVRNAETQTALVGVGVFTLLLLTVKAHYSIDMKLLIFLIFGYFIGGKSFSYLSPTPSLPLFVGEVSLLLMSLGLMLRNKLYWVDSFRRDWLFTMILLIGGLTLFRLYIDYKIYGLLAIRDASVVYYSAFCIGGYYLFAKVKYRIAFEKLFPIALALGLVSEVLNKFVFSKVASLSFLWNPYPDLSIPVAIACGFLVCLKGGKTTKTFLLLFLISVGIIFVSKTAYLFCFSMTLLIFIVWSKRIYLLSGAISLAVIGSLFVGLLSVLNIVDMESMGSNDAMGTVFSVVDGDLEAGASTTGWRLTWWKTIYRDTMATNPFFGAGLGGDITTSFYREAYGKIIDPATPGLPRYPHNVFFTVLGRFGLVGVFLFLIYVITFVVFMYRFAKKFLCGKYTKPIHVLTYAYVFAGFFNAFVQATYEVPYAAITHWVTLGYLLRVHYTKKVDEVSSEDLTGKLTQEKTAESGKLSRGAYLKMRLCEEKVTAI